jgi:glycosyltransferase involved in cell wall biosynthesis
MNKYLPLPSSPVRVLAVTNMFPTAEDRLYGIFVSSQMESIARAGARVHVEFIDGRSNNWNYLTGIARIRRVAATHDFDVVHAHFGLTGFVCLFQDLPLVVSFCGDDLLGNSDGRGGATVRSRPMVWMSRIAARRADAVICKSDSLAAALPQEVDRSRVSVIANGVDTALFCPGDRDEARRHLGISNSERLVLFPHNITQRVKRYDLASAAAAILVANGIEARLWVVNGVPHDQLPQYYRAADCLLLTSDHEGSPNTVKEGLCCDLPVVSVDVGDVKRLVQMTPGSKLVPRDPQQIAAALASVLNSQQRIDGSVVRDELGLSAVADRVLRVYYAAIGNARKSPSGAPVSKR